MNKFSLGLITGLVAGFTATLVHNDQGKRWGQIAKEQGALLKQDAEDLAASRKCFETSKSELAAQIAPAKRVISDLSDDIKLYTMKAKRAQTALTDDLASLQNDNDPAK